MAICETTEARIEKIAKSCVTKPGIAAPAMKGKSHTKQVNGYYSSAGHYSQSVLPPGSITITVAKERSRGAITELQQATKQRPQRRTRRESSVRETWQNLLKLFTIRDRSAVFHLLQSRPGLFSIILKTLNRIRLEFPNPRCELIVVADPEENAVVLLLAINVKESDTKAFKQFERFEEWWYNQPCNPEHQFVVDLRFHS